MENVFPPFRVDIAGTFCVPRTLKDAREQYRNGQIGLHTMQAIEDAEVRSLVSRLKEGGMKVVTDGGFRNREFVENWDEYRQAVLDSFSFLTGVTGGDVLAKQHLPSPAEILARILRSMDEEQLKREYPDRNLLLDEIAAQFKRLLDELHAAGCRYVQFNGVHSVPNEESVQLNNRVLSERPADLYVAFHAPTDMLIQLTGADAYFLNYDWQHCDRSRLLWFIREEKSVFGFVLSRYPEEEELDDLQAKIEEVLHYISLKRFTLCLPDASSFQTPLEPNEEKQWDTLRLGMVMAERLYGDL